MNWVYVGIAAIDMVKMFVVFKFVFGFDLCQDKRRWIITAMIVLSSQTTILILEDTSNRIFIMLGSQILVQAILFEGYVRSKVELTVLLHFFISTIDGLIHGILLFALHSQDLMPKYIGGSLQGLADIGGMIIIGFLIIFLTPYRKKIYVHLENFTLKMFFYYLVCLFLSGVVIGYAGIMATDILTVSRLRTATFIGANGMGILVILFAILVHVYMIQNKNLKRSNAFTNQCLDEQAKQYELIGTKNEELKRFRHDYNAHLHSLKKLVETGNIHALSEYLGDLDDLERTFDYVSTNNITGDAVTNEYFEKCQVEKIEFKVIGQFSDLITISNSDLCTLLSNGVKNAFEAASACMSERFIYIEIKNYKKRTFVTIKNTVNPISTLKNGMMKTSKKDDENHGFGMRNMLDIAEKYGGRVSWQYDGETTFLTKIEI